MTDKYLLLISSPDFLKQVNFKTREQVEDCIKFLFTRNLLFEDELDYLLTKLSELKNN
jgi:hypothetical protein